jgi:hypothetical protein
MNASHMPTGSQNHHTSGQVTNLVRPDSHPEISHLMEEMNVSNRSLFCRSYKEVLEDYDMVKERLDRAHVINNFYNLSYKL